MSSSSPTQTPPWGTVSLTKEQEEAVRETLAPRTHTTYSTPEGTTITFTNEEEEEIYREAASTLPAKLRNLEPTWYRQTPDGPLIFLWGKIAREGGYLKGFSDEELTVQLAHEMGTRLNQVREKKMEA